ncbi:phage major capsid protein [bacterium]|nr:MAG: phage major capsid protein [bacterium]
MSQKIMNELIAKRANLTNLIRGMVDNGITNENQHNYDKAIADFQAMTKQIDDLKMIDAAADKFEDIIKPVSSKDGFMNFLRFGDASNVEKIVNAVGVGSGSAGYLVPEELSNAIVRIMY